ncbi:hypothetical protein G6F56_002452 [Rhizopus delemar]|uniref:Uncharacterized protein n=1 Tax=Rhizopus stolonifer TaxID=4846 RepID=A0A367K2A9_RHIST|nr:hypothetical protein G6F56_002452 [Rhizopus delemar]RCH96306.1 hypothetical protein CU098_006056 [Rhizopus stolonifer]
MGLLPASQQPIKKALPDTLLFYVRNLSQINQALMTPTFQPTKPKENSFVISHLPTMTFFNLTYDKASVKIFGRMATETHDQQTRFTCAKYLIQFVSFYTNNKQTNNQAVSVTSAETRNRLQEEAKYWIIKLTKSNHPEALYIKGH